MSSTTPVGPTTRGSMALRSLESEIISTTDLKLKPEGSVSFFGKKPPVDKPMYMDYSPESVRESFQKLGLVGPDTWKESSGPLTLDPSNGLGENSALSDDGMTLVMGRETYDSRKGGASVFVLVDGLWAEQTVLTATDHIGNSIEGYSVAISADGNTVVTGGRDDDSNIGAAWVYTRINDVWSVGTKIVGTGYVGTPQQGRVSVSGDGKTVAVGGIEDDSEMGAVWIFKKTGSSWVQQGPKLVGTATWLDGAGQGESVSLSGDGNTLAFGAPGRDDGDVDKITGGVFVFTRASGIWTQKAFLTMDSIRGNAALLGISTVISRDGNTIVSGAPEDEFETGSVVVFNKSEDIWSQTAILRCRDNLSYYDFRVGLFGFSVDISPEGDRIIAGAHGRGEDEGGVFVFINDNGVWTQEMPKFIQYIDDEGYEIEFGHSVSISSNNFVATTEAEQSFWVYDKV